jgi:hypothetical protein
MAEIGQAIVKDHLEAIGLRVEKIKEGEEKSVDFIVFQNETPVFYLEEKTLEDDVFEGCKKDPTYNSISAHVHKAAKQFISVNRNRALPNVLAFVNMDISRDYIDLLITLTGIAPTENETNIKIRNIGRVAKDLAEIDLYLWFNNDSLGGVIYSQINYNHDLKLKNILVDLEHKMIGES